ncbi:MAG: 6-carboxytetrahydropterin synthase QueD [Dehalococcoidales bacterium]
MYEIAVESHFDAAHFLRGYQGKCEALHGHRFRVVARINAAGLDDAGMAYDFTKLRKHLNDILDKFDHTCLNDVPPFDEINPSSEHLATITYRELSEKLAGAPVSVSSVEVWESPQSGATYRPD